MRIITGKARGVALDTLPGETTRPTGAKIKEAVFSAIQFDIEGRTFLDLFAGSGQMGLEALSRGAKQAMFVDASQEAMAIVKANAKKTGLFDMGRYLVSDYRNYIRKAAGKDRFDIVYIDPPYAEKAACDAVLRLLKADLVKPHTLFIIESAEEDIFEADASLWDKFDVLKKKAYGLSFIHILRQKEAET